MVTADTSRTATLADLARHPGKGELVKGRIVPLMPTGFTPGRIGGRIFRSLDEYCELLGSGAALPDNVGFAVTELPSGRASFAPDVAFVAVAPQGVQMGFVQGPPSFAVEVRSENDYGAAAEDQMAAKRADYFAAGTLAVWDVDPLAKSVLLFTGDAHQPSAVFGPGDQAHAQAAVPGWSVAVDRIFS